MIGFSLLIGPQLVHASTTIADKLAAINGMTYMRDQPEYQCGLRVLTDPSSLKLFLEYKTVTPYHPFTSCSGGMVEVQCTPAECSFGPERMRTVISITGDQRLVMTTYDQVHRPQNIEPWTPYTMSECATIGAKNYCVGETVVFADKYSPRDHFYRGRIKALLLPMGLIQIFEDDLGEAQETPENFFRYKLMNRTSDLRKTISCTEGGWRVCVNDTIVYRQYGAQVRVTNVFEGNIIEYHFLDSGGETHRFLNLLENFEPVKSR
jgi:hypothetical protein